MKAGSLNGGLCTLNEAGIAAKLDELESKQFPATPDT